MTVSSSIIPRGVVFARYIKALAIARGDILGAQAYAEGQNSWNIETPAVVAGFKAAVSAMGTGDSAGTLIHPVAVDFAEYLRPLTIIGRLKLRRAPFLTRLVLETSGTTAAWVGEVWQIPATSAAFSFVGSSGTVSIQPTKVATLVALTSELVKLSRPSADALIAADVGRACATALDVGFIDPSNSGIPSVRPASVTYGAPSFVSGGAGLAEVDADLQLLVGSLTAAEMPFLSASWVMSPKTAAALGALRGSGGAPAYPGLGPTGGSLLGVPVLTSTAARGCIVLLEASEILLADDGEAAIDYSEEASVQLSDTPNPTGGPTDSLGSPMVSLWENNLVGIRAARYANWVRRHPGAAAVLTGVAF